jgi:hypothetical protein
MEDSKGASLSESVHPEGDVGIDPNQRSNGEILTFGLQYI